MKSEKKNERSEISSLLRFVGLLSVFASGVSFMVQGWGELADLTKYLSFFGFVGMLSGLSFLFQRQFKDQTTSRVFAVLSTLGVTTLFSQVGSILYSSMYPDTNEIPSMFNLVVPISDFTLIGLLTTLLMIPITMVGFESIIKSKSIQASLLFLTLNFFMLVPTRQSGWTALFLMIQTAILCLGYKEWKIQATISDRWSRLGFFALMSAPILTVMVRALYYSVGAYYFAMVFAMVGAVLLFVPSEATDDEDPILFQFQTALGYGSWLISWLFLSYKIRVWVDLELIHTSYYNQLNAYIISGGLALISYIVYVLKDRSIEFFKYAVIFFLNAAVLSSMAVGFTLLSHVAGFFIGATLLVYSIKKGFKFLSLMSLASILYSFSYYVDFVKYLYQKSPWLFFAIAGVLLIIVSAFYSKIAGFMESLRTQHPLNPDQKEPYRQDL